MEYGAGSKVSTISGLPKNIMWSEGLVVLTSSPLSEPYRFVSFPPHGWVDHVDEVRVVEVHLVRSDTDDGT